jgi:hypothetical protein
MVAEVAGGVFGILKYFDTPSPNTTVRSLRILKHPCAGRHPKTSDFDVAKRRSNLGQKLPKITNPVSDLTEDQ